MKARPILFSGPMIRALLDGRKTQHRDELVPYAEVPEAVGWVYEKTDRHSIPLIAYNAWWADLGKGNRTGLALCPFGHVGDLLYVRETPDMPRQDNRLTLEITDVRVERLQDISEADSVREGILSCSDGLPPGCPPVFGFDTENGGFSEDMAAYTPQAAFKGLWQSINGVASWDANPWVWVLTFKVHHCNVDNFIGGRHDEQKRA